MAPEDVAARSGHSDIQITQQHYRPWVCSRAERIGDMVKDAYRRTTLRRIQFGRRSEKIARQIEQLELRLEDLESKRAETQPVVGSNLYL